jgi:hypothetical protein
LIVRGLCKKIKKAGGFFMGIKVEKLLKKIGYIGLAGVSLQAYAAQEPGVDQAQEYFGVPHDRDEKAQQELREWLLEGVVGEFAEQAGDQVGEQERGLFDQPNGERFMASEPRLLITPRSITPASPESLSGDCADGEESSASRERLGGQSASRSASRDGSRNGSGREDDIEDGIEDGGSQDGGSMRASMRIKTRFLGFRNNSSGYAADLDNQGRQVVKPRLVKLVKQEKIIIPAVLRAQNREWSRAQSWTYAQDGVQAGAGQQAHREPTNDHRARMELAMREMRDSYSN